MPLSADDFLDAAPSEQPSSDDGLGYGATGSVAPDVQAKRDAVRLQMLQGERSSTPESDPASSALDTEIDYEQRGIGFDGRPKTRVASAAKPSADEFLDAGPSPQARAAVAPPNEAPPKALGEAEDFGDLPSLSDAAKEIVKWPTKLVAEGASFFGGVAPMAAGYTAYALNRALGASPDAAIQAALAARESTDPGAGLAKLADAAGVDKSWIKSDVAQGFMNELNEKWIQPSSEKYFPAQESLPKTLYEDLANLATFGALGAGAHGAKAIVERAGARPAVETAPLGSADAFLDAQHTAQVPSEAQMAEERRGVPMTFQPPDIAAMKADNLSSAPGVQAPAVGNEIPFQGRDPRARAGAVEQAQAAEAARQADAAMRVQPQPIDLAQEKAANLELAPSPTPALGNEIDIEPFLRERALMKANAIPVQDWMAQGDLLGRKYDPETINLMARLAAVADDDPMRAARAYQEIEDYNPAKEAPHEAPPAEDIHAAPAPDAGAQRIGEEVAAQPRPEGQIAAAAAADAARAAEPATAERPASAPGIAADVAARDAAAAAVEVPRRAQASAPGGEGLPLAEVDRAAHEAATSPRNALPEPTEPQKLAGNYQKGHTRIAGLDISIENPAGSKRRPQWPTLQSHYGYIKGTIGRDKDHVDIFVKPSTPRDYAGPVYVVDQTKAGGRGFDEHKAVLGASSIEEAKKLYAENYTRGWKVGPITEMSMPEFRAWTKSGFTKRAVSSLSRSERESLTPPMSAQEIARIRSVAPEIGWSQEGGRMIRAVDTGGEKPEVVGRTTWIPKSDFWPSRPRGVTTRDAKSALAKLDTGERMNAAEKRFVDHAKTWLDQQYAKSAAVQPRREVALRRAVENVDTSQMSREELAHEVTRLRGEVYTDRLTGLGNRAAYEEAPKKAFQVSMDLDSLKWINDEMGHAAGDSYIQVMGRALAEVLGRENAYHPSGDEFIAQFDDEGQAHEAIAAARALLDQRAMVRAYLKDGSVATLKGVGFSYGLGKDLAEADHDLQRNKQDRQDEGHRAGRGEPPPQLAIEPAKPADAGGIPHRPAGQAGPGQVAKSSRAPLELKGETDGEIRAREAQQAKAADEEKKRAAAPTPEGFTLTGSDRVVDVARAHGQQELIGAAEKIEPAKPEAPVENVSTAAESGTESQAARVADFGEKIGGARKDVAKPLGPRTKIAKAEDERPSWARKYHAMQVVKNPMRVDQAGVGKWQLMKETGGTRGSVEPVMRRQFFETEAEALASIPLAEVSRKHRVFGYSEGGTTRYGIYRLLGERKRALVKGGFESEDAAMRAMVADPVSIIEHKFAFPERPWLDRVLRVGPTDRTGNVTPEMFKDTFGFRGGEFGNWNMGGDGQAALNHAYDGLLDLAHTLGVPPKALSLNGDLAIAFGARGHGGMDSAAAHYEPEKRVINLTKIHGAGSLAHEWFHALDHYLGQQAGKTGEGAASTMLTYGPHWKNTARPELLKAFDNVVRAMTTKTEGRAIEEEGAKRGLTRAQENVNGSLDRMRSYIAKNRDWGKKRAAATPAQLAAWDALAERALKGDNGADVRMPGQGRLGIGYPSSEVVRGLNDIYKQVLGHSFDTADSGSAGRQLYWGIRSLADMNARVAKAQEGAIEQRHTATDFLAEAKRVDGYRASDYWSTPHEMGARAFESYIFDKLMGHERPSQYLVHGVENKYYALLGMKPYPEGAERQAINHSFDALFKAIQTKETDRGTALFGRRFNDQGGMRPEDVRAVVEPIVAKWVNGPDVKVLPSFADAPIAVRGHDANQRAQGAEGTPYAFFHEGSVYLIADQTHSPEQAAIGLFHEALGHYGLRGVFGQAIERELAGVAAARPAEIKDMAKRYGLDPLIREDRLVAAEEVLAHFAQEHPELSFVQRVVATVRNWLRTHGMNLQWTDNDIIQHFVLPARRFVEEGRAKATPDGAAFARGDDSTRFTRSAGPSWAEDEAPAVREALKKAGVIETRTTLKQRIAGLKQAFGMEMRQGLVDQFAPLRDLDERAYMQARLSKATDGGLEALMLHGKPKLTDGALDVGHEGGLIKSLQKLEGEHDRFLAWVAGHRAADLKAQGRENLFTSEDITALKDLDRGQLKSGRPRTQAYAEALHDFRAYGKSVLDIAEQTGLIDAAGRKMWESDFYVPFYRAMEDGSASGPKGGRGGGLVNQYAFKKLKGGADNLHDLLANTLRNWSHLLSASMKNQAAVRALEAAEAMKVAEKLPQQEKGSLMVWKGGEKHFYEVSDPFVLDALRSLDFNGFRGRIMTAMSAPKKWLTFGTTVSPVFRIRNLMRDTIASISQSDLSYNPFKNLADGWAATRHSSDARARLIAGGGIIRFGTMLEGDRATHVKRLIEAGVKADTIIDTPGKLRGLMTKAWDAYQETGERSEAINRAALYEQLRAQGKDHLEASYAARDLLDFSMQGKWAAVRFANQVLPFANARLQGLYKLGRTFPDSPGRVTAVIGALAMARLALWALYHNDDDWKRREDWDRDNYLWFKVGNTAYRIPSPFEIGAIASTAERMAEYIYSTEPQAGQRFANRLASLVFDQLSMNPVPQLFKPAIEAIANKDFFTGRPIESQGMEKLSPHNRVGPNTSIAAQALAQLDPSGQVSPLQIDHLVKGYFGWLGTMSLAAGDALVNALHPPESPQPAKNLHRTPVIGDFAETLPSDQSRYVTWFYNQLQQVEQAYGDWHNAQQMGHTDEADALHEKNADALAQYPAMERAKRQLTLLNERARKIRESEDMTPVEKRDELSDINQRRHEIARTTMLEE